jgi:hypothetical protein
VEIRRERPEHPPQRSPLDPGLKTAMTCLIRRVPIGEIFPRGAGAQDPQDAIQYVPRVAPRAPALIVAHARLRQEWRENRPLRVRQVHAVEYDGNRNFVHRPRWGRYPSTACCAIIAHTSSSIDHKC